MTTTDNEAVITVKEFLENVAPGTIRQISDIYTKRVAIGSSTTPFLLNAPEIRLHCTGHECQGLRRFCSNSKVQLNTSTATRAFVIYSCKDCSEIVKTFALHISLDLKNAAGTLYKYGERPEFGPPTPARLITLIGPDRDLFLKGRRAENQGLGIAAFAYYRRVIEGQKDRIFEEIIRVCKRLSGEQAIVDELTSAKSETQFSKAVESVKRALPQALLINGHNPLTLLHTPLSEGLHAQTDEECLEIATDIRVVMAAFAERMAQAMSDEAEVSTAVSRLLKSKVPAKKSSTLKQSK
jgi:hypothetical protein